MIINDVSFLWTESSARKHDWVCSLCHQVELAWDLFFYNDTHSLPCAIERELGKDYILLLFLLLIVDLNLYVVRSFLNELESYITRTLDKRQLIWRGCLHYLLPCLFVLVQYHCMAYSHKFEEFMTCFHILKIWIWDLEMTNLEQLLCFIKSRIHFPVNRALLKLHDVASKRSSLVREDKFYLSHFLDQVRVSANREASFRIIDIDVSAYQIGLSKLNHLKDYIEWDGDQVRVCYPVCKILNYEAHEARVWVQVQIRVWCTCVSDPKDW